MGMLDPQVQEPRIVDAYGVPGYFATEFISEPIGEGCIRIYGCILQRGVLVPQYYVNAPHQCILRGAQTVLQSAVEISLQMQRAARLAH
jgi:hypothetical protein